MLHGVGIAEPGLVSDAVACYNRHFRQIVSNDKVARLFPTVVDTLRALRKNSFRLALATNEIREILDHLVAALNIDSLFDASVCTAEFDDPNPRLLNEFGGNAQDTLVVGDSVFDIKMGKAAGCMTCAVSYGVHSETKLRRQQPDWLIDDFSQLLEIEPVSAAFEQPG